MKSMQSTRQPTNHTKDRQVYKATADKVKSINIKPTQMRGGIRL